MRLGTPGVLLSLISCSCGLDSRNNQPQPSASPSSQPIRSDQQSRAEQSGAERQSTRARGHVKFKVTATHGRCHAVGLASGGARLQSQFDEIRINRPLESISLPLPPTPRLTLFPHLWSQPPFSLLSPFSLLLLLPVTSHNPHPASTPADALRCTCRQTEPSRGESRPLSARPPAFSPVDASLRLCTRGLQKGSRAPADASLAPRCGPSNRLIGPAPAIISAVPTTFALPTTTTLPFRSSHPAAAAYCCCCAAATGLKLRPCSSVFPSDETPRPSSFDHPTPLPLRQLKSAPCHFAGPPAARGSSLNCLSGTRNQTDGPSPPLPPRPCLISTCSPQGLPRKHVRFVRRSDGHHLDSSEQFSWRWQWLLLGLHVCKTRGAFPASSPLPVASRDQHIMCR